MDNIGLEGNLNLVGRNLITWSPHPRYVAAYFGATHFGFSLAIFTLGHLHEWIAQLILINQRAKQNFL